MSSEFSMAKAMARIGQAAQVQQNVDAAQVARRKLAALVAKHGGNEKKLKAACQDFEAIFISKLWKQMRQNVPKGGYLHSKQEEFYLSMFDHELSRKMARSGGMGLGDMLFGQLKERLKASAASNAPGAKPEAAQGSDGETLPGIPLRQPQHGIALKPQGIPFTPAEAQPPAPVVPPAGSDLASRIDALAREIEQSASGAKPVAPQAPKVAEPNPAMPAITWPVQGEVISGFGQPGAQGPAQGVVIKAPAGEPVRACLPGAVSFAGVRDGRHVLEITHPGGLTSVYAGVSAPQVAQGDWVKAGHEIAIVPPKEGLAGSISFQVRHGNVALNPELLRAA